MDSKDDPLARDVAASMAEIRALFEAPGEIPKDFHVLEFRLKQLQASDLSPTAKAAGEMLLLNNAKLGRSFGQMPR